MDENETPIEAIEPTEPGAAGAPEGTPPVQPTADDVQSMYDELGIKAKAPSGATKGRPKSDNVRNKDVSDKGNDNTKSGRQDEQPGGDKPKDAPDPAKNGSAGNKTDKKGEEVSEDAGKVSEKSEEVDGAIRDPKPGAEKDSEPGSEDDSEPGADGAGQDADDEATETEEGKRPGKSNPKIEQRFQKLSTDIKERDEIIEKLQAELQETTQKHQQAQIAQEDPEYTVDDFRKVRDEEGNVLDLDDNQAELAWRRWKDGYDQRKVEREAEFNHAQAIEKYQQETTDKLMRSSAEAYDTLTGILDSYPELSSQSPEYDAELSKSIMPIIEDMVMYQPGTEPGNGEGYQPVIIGMKMNPSKVLDVIKQIKSAKRALPLNGINDNVDTRSNVQVSHGRSSDPTINAANQLYKELNINKRF